MMYSENEIKNCFQVLKNNISVIHELTEQLYIKTDFEAWRELYKRRSLQIRNIIMVNEGPIRIIVDCINTTLSDSMAELLYNEYREMMSLEVHDSVLLTGIIRKLIPFYEAKHDTEKLLHLYSDSTYESQSYLRFDEKAMESMLYKDLKKLVSMREEYASLPNISERRLFCIAYYNLLSSLPEFSDEFRKELIDIYKEARRFYQSDEVKKTNDLDMISFEKNLLNIVLLHNFMYYLDDGISQQMEYVDLIDEIKDTFDDFLDTDLCNQVLSYFHDQTSDEELAYYLKKHFDFYYNELKELDFKEESDAFYVATDNMITAANMFYDFLKMSYMSLKEKNEIGRTVTAMVYDFLKKVPYNVFRSYFDDISIKIYKKALPYLYGIEEKEDIIERFIIRRQPMTYTHSHMVEKIALDILDAIHFYSNPIIDSMMEQTNLYGYDLRNYVARAARLHDLGKCVSVNLINQQGRKLVAKEMSYIKHHPEVGKLILADDSSFMEYYDVIVGHHKSYDGKSGYPLDFDNTKSKYKLIIDLISIADSIDAATDLYGRNYKEGKTIEQLLEEFNKEAGTRYNPEIVSFIQNTPDLLLALKYFATEGRCKENYDLYFSGKK